MTRHTAVTLALAMLVALSLSGLTPTSRAQDAQRTVNLSPGCNMTTLTFADGTDAATLTTAVSPPGALQTAWRLDNATGSFQAFTPQAPQASDLTSLSLLDPVFICVDAIASISMPALSPDPSGPPMSIDLASGCNAVGLCFPDGTTPSQVGDAVTPPTAFESMWRHDAAQGSFQAYVAAAPQASDLTSLQFLDAVFICTGEVATLDLPAVSEPGPEAVTGPPTDIRFVMEAAVPQLVDLPRGFTALDEAFETSDSPDAPPGGLYWYGIVYGNVLGLIDPQLETLFFAQFELIIFDTVNHATSWMKELTSISADEFKAEVEPELAGSAGLEVGSLTIQEIEPQVGIGEEASFIRVRMQVRRVRSNDFFMPMAMDYYVIRRERVIGLVFAAWTPGPPGPDFIPENLAKKMDAGIQAAMPQFLAAVP